MVGTRYRRFVLVLAGAALLVAGAVSFRSLSQDDVASTAMPGACENLAVVTRDPNALADEVFTFQSADGDSVAKLEDACDETSRL